MPNAPYMRILTADLRWEKIENLKIGDEVIATDENVPYGGKGTHEKCGRRRYKLSRSFEEAFELVRVQWCDFGRNRPTSPFVPEAWCE